MSETIAMPPLGTVEKGHVPTVYFIDDSATMREVIKIAFRRENIHVITCADASSALSQFEEHPPDIVITDVIMPDQDGYSVCSHIKQSPQYGKTPVILMSGVVNKSVADRAVAVQADELVRKPFQPQELIGRVKNLLGHVNPPTQAKEEQTAAVPTLNSLFAAPPSIPQAPPRLAPAPVPVSLPSSAEPSQGEGIWPRALAEAFLQQNPGTQPQAPQQMAPPQQRAQGANGDSHKLRAEIARLDLLIKKLQTELQIERQYNQALELHVRNLLEID
jgi:twitching motility two-component system response regulator PilH